MGGMTWDKYELWKLTLANKTEEQVTHEGYRTISTPSVSTDGRVVYAASLSGGASSMFLLDLGDSPPTPAPFAPANPGTSSEWGPTFAPDGRSVVFVSDRAAQFDYELWERTNASGVLRQLTFLRSYLGTPAFGPGGTTIVFLSDKGRSNKFELVSYDTRTGVSVRLTKLRPE